MDILTHFRSIEELTKTLSREQGLLSEMFEKRKLISSNGRERTFGTRHLSL